MTHVTCRLTAKDRDQLRNHTLGNRVCATFTVLLPSLGHHRTLACIPHPLEEGGWVAASFSERTNPDPIQPNEA